jgi:hypothetical protein
MKPANDNRWSSTLFSATEWAEPAVEVSRCNNIVW